MQSNQDKDRLAELEARWLDGTITPEEAAEYAEWYNEGQDAPVYIPSSFAASREDHRKRILARIQNRSKGTGVRSIRMLRVTAAAAAVLLIFAGIAFWQFKHTAGPSLSANIHPSRNDVPPGKMKGMLRLSNGKTIHIGSSSSGLSVHQGVIHFGTEDSVLTDNGTGDEAASGFNTFYTNRGEEYQLTLSDGTKVWLNSASSLNFPSSFTGNSREVTLTGEAYFEVVANAKMPFRVQVNGLQVEDLGTRFNINAYEDEPDVKTTLLEGAVRVSGKRGNVVLVPGEQAVVDIARSGKIKVQTVYAEETVAWKNRKFSFHHTGIDEVMRQISRWYDVEVDYRDFLDIKLSGSVSKDVNLSQVLTMLERVGDVKFRIEGKKIVVMK
ncbi:FecR family protein [Compostibacter hankyongensis]|uniref:DUF4974 domain-containing protein n=1 Tax=Compostibacter hankyongensis TaxID=1007089 RepID=A0ABP8FX95_9BACT